MLQRLQSLLLAILILVMISAFFLPVYTKSTTNLEMLKMDLFKTTLTIKELKVTEKQNFILAILAFASIGLSAYAISLFKNRPRQLLVCVANSLVLAILLGLMVYSALEANNILPTSVPGKFGFAFFVPSICLILNMISIRFIRRDERLVKDAFDRLR